MRPRLQRCLQRRLQRRIRLRMQLRIRQSMQLRTRLPLWLLLLQLCRRRPQQLLNQVRGRHRKRGGRGGGRAREETIGVLGRRAKPEGQRGLLLVRGHAPLGWNVSDW